MIDLIKLKKPKQLSINTSVLVTAFTLVSVVVATITANIMLAITLLLAHVLNLDLNPIIAINSALHVITILVGIWLTIELISLLKYLLSGLSG